jgi:Ni,Fe-hydrogenase I cytochrome b subunit
MAAGHTEHGLVCPAIHACGSGARCQTERLMACQPCNEAQHGPLRELALMFFYMLLSVAELSGFGQCFALLSAALYHFSSFLDGWFTTT